MAKCILCSKIVNKKCPGLQCDKCSRWFHAACAKVSIDQLNTLSATNDVDWKCKSCVGSQKPKRLSYIVPEPEEDDGEISDVDGQGRSSSSGAINLQPILRTLRTEIRNIIREELQTTLKFYSDTIDEYTRKINTYETNMKLLENQCTDLKNNIQNTNLKYSALESKINQIEQKQLMSQLEICGVPEMENDNPEKIAKTIATTIQVDPDDVMKAFRRKRTRPAAKAAASKAENPVITVTLRDGTRNHWLDKAKGARLTVAALGWEGEGKIYLRESLAPGIGFLLWKTKEALKDYFKYIWCKNGTILLRKEDNAKIFSLRSIYELEKLKTAQSYTS